jgi:cysteine desulfurase
VHNTIINNYFVLASLQKIPASALAANPSALHKEGVQFKGYLDRARSVAAKALNAHADEIIFTSGATESDNLALAGSVKNFLSQGIESDQIMIFASDIEHAAVTETAQNLGVRYGAIPAVDGVVDPRAIIMPQDLKVLIISVMYVNNEIGTVQPIKEIAKRVRQLRKQYPDITILFHVDGK